MLGLAFFFSSIGSADASGAEETQMSISPHAMLKETATKNTLQILTQGDDEEFVRKELKDISVIVEQAQPEFTLESHGFQEFPNAFPEIAMEDFNTKVNKNRGGVYKEMLEDLWPIVKKELMEKMRKQTCRARLGAPPDAESICARYRTGTDACEGDPMCYENKLVSLQFLNKHLAGRVSKSQSGSKYIKDYIRKRTKEDKKTEEFIYSVYDIFNTTYRRTRVKPKKTGLLKVRQKKGTQPIARYRTDDIKNPSWYENVDDEDWGSRRYKFDAKPKEPGAFFLHIDTKEPTSKLQLIQDSGKHVRHREVEYERVENETEEGKKGPTLVSTVFKGYVGELYNFWAPVMRPDEDAPQKYEDTIDTCPLVFQDNASLGKVYTAATTIGTVVGWKTGFQKHGALGVFEKDGFNLRINVEFRVFELWEKPQALYEGTDFDCANLKKEDCKPEATKSKCAWDLDEKACTTRCPAYDVATTEQRIPNENLGSFCTPKVDACAEKCSSMDDCKAFSFKKMSAKRRCASAMFMQGNCILLGGEPNGRQSDFLGFLQESSFSHRVCLRRG